MKRNQLPAGSALALLALVGTLHADDWSQFRGPGGLAVSKDRQAPVTWSPTQNIAWKAALPGPGTSCPIIIGERIYLTCFTGYNIPGQGEGSPDDLRRHLLCLNRKDGKLLWSSEVKPSLPEGKRPRDDHGYASNTPVADAAGVIAFFGKAGVFTFDHEGKQLWQSEVGSGTSGWGSAASPVLFGDLVIVNASVESESLIALDRKTGKERWRVGRIQEAWNTPLLVTHGDRTELIVAVPRKVLSFDPATGKQLWSCGTDITWYMVPSMVAHDGIVYCIGGRSGNDGSLAIRLGGEGDVTATHRLWRVSKRSNVSSPVYHEGHLYFAHEQQGIVYCLSAKTGEAVYEERLPRGGQIYASPVLAAGKLYYISRNGIIWVVAAKPTFELLAQNTLEERGTFNSSPAVHRGQLLVRSDRYLYCIGDGSAE